MDQFRCLTALRVLAKSRGPHRHLLIERHIDQYLEPILLVSLTHLSGSTELSTTKSLKGAKARIGA